MDDRHRSRAVDLPSRLGLLLAPSVARYGRTVAAESTLCSVVDRRAPLLHSDASALLGNRLRPTGWCDTWGRLHVGCRADVVGGDADPDWREEPGTSRLRLCYPTENNCERTAASDLLAGGARSAVSVL